MECSPVDRREVVRSMQGARQDSSTSNAPGRVGGGGQSGRSGGDESRVIEGATSTVTFSDVLANKDYRSVIIAQFVSNIGGWMEMFAIQIDRKSVV